MYEVYFEYKGAVHTMDVRKSQASLADIVCELRQYATKIIIILDDRTIYYS